jgi:transcriptional regulator with XRE-family HTH domain
LFCSQRNLTQPQLALLADISVSHLSLLEHNKRDVSLSTLTRIAHALNVSLVVLIFMALEKDELTPFDIVMRERLSYSVFESLKDGE